MEAQHACNDYGSIIQAVVGSTGYETLLQQLLTTVETHQQGERSVSKSSVSTLH